jgi:hypothetical protein
MRLLSRFWKLLRNPVFAVIPAKAGAHAPKNQILTRPRFRLSPEWQTFADVSVFDSKGAWIVRALDLNIAAVLGGQGCALCTLRGLLQRARHKIFMPFTQF